MRKSSIDLTVNQEPSNGIKKQDSCCICGMICAPFDKGVYRLTAPDGNKISFCYQHLLDIIKRNRSLPDVPTKISDFDLISFLDKTKEFLEKNNEQTEEVLLLKKFLRKTRLDDFMRAPAQVVQQI